MKFNAGTTIGFLLQRAHTSLREKLIEALDGTGVHLGHIAILGFLAETPNLTQSELSAATGIEKSSMVLFLDYLEREGWLKRESHPTDRRAHSVCLTDTGKRRLGALGPPLRQAEKKFLSSLTEAEQTNLRNLLLALTGKQ